MLSNSRMQTALKPPFTSRGYGNPIKPLLVVSVPSGNNPHSPREGTETSGIPVSLLTSLSGKTPQPPREGAETFLLAYKVVVQIFRKNP